MKMLKRLFTFFLNQVTPDRFAREPWLYRKKATKQERRQQAVLQSAWCAQGNCRFAEDVYISPGATVNPRHLILGAGTAIGSEAQIGYDLEMGARCTVNAGAVVRGKVRTGDDVRIATGAQVLGFNHGSKDLTIPMHQQPITRKGIFIGDDVWIGANAVILDGVTVGSHSIIGAGAIVTHDVPAWTVVAGSPATVINSRKYGRAYKNKSVFDTWQDFGNKVVTEMDAVLKRSFHSDSFFDFPDDEPKARPWTDAVELAVMTRTVLPGYDRAQLIDRLRGFQDPASGLVPGPYEEDLLSKGGVFVNKMECRHSAYMVMAVGYALECLGSSLQYPVTVADRLTTEDLLSHLSSLPWAQKTWNCGAWIDHFATACYFNARYHGLSRDMSDLLGWLHQHADQVSGLWGKPYPDNDWLQPVNGFYRITRGVHAQWGWALPYPKQTIDTVLAHAHDQHYFGSDTANACIVLDIIHPLWLCLKQTDYRRNEIAAVAQFWLNDTINRWYPGKGMSFSCGPAAIPSLKGTEMWLSIAWYCANILQITSENDAYNPVGVHRPQPVAPKSSPLGT